MWLVDLRFDEVAPTRANAISLASAWYPRLSGSAESRMEQVMALQILSEAIFHLMSEPKADRNMARVREMILLRDDARLIDPGLGHASIDLNVSDARSTLASRNWPREGC